MLCVVSSSPMHLRVLLARGAASGGARELWEVHEGWRNIWHAIILWSLDVKRSHGVRRDWARGGAPVCTTAAQSRLRGSQLAFRQDYLAKVLAADVD